MTEGVTLLKAQGMTCDGCGRTIRRMLAREPGVRHGSVGWKSGTARVSFDPSVTAPNVSPASSVFRSRFRATLSER